LLTTKAAGRNVHHDGAMAETFKHFLLVFVEVYVKEAEETVHERE
jgi:hypothetical protein